jgi:hypothetical protein
MEKKMEYIEFKTLRSNDKGGTILNLKQAKNGYITFELALQCGTVVVNGKTLPKFDYENKSVFQFSDLELAEIALTINRQLLGMGHDTELNFPHLNGSSVPKQITFKFSTYNNKPQMLLNVYHTKTQQAYSIYLNEKEMEVIREWCTCQYNPSLRRINTEYYDDKDFKNYVADMITKIAQMMGIR